MKDTVASARYWVEKDKRERNEPEEDAKRQFAAFHHDETGSATERANSPPAASDRQHNADNAISSLLAGKDPPTEARIFNEERQHSTDSTVCVQRQVSSLNQVDGQNEEHEPWGTLTSQDALRTGEVAERGRRYKTESPKMENLPYVEACDNVHRNPILEDFRAKDSMQQQKENLQETTSERTVPCARGEDSPEIKAVRKTQREPKGGHGQREDSAEDQDENGGTDTSKYTNFVQEGAEAQAIQDEIQTTNVCQKVIYQGGMQGEMDGRESFPFPEKSTPFELPPTVAHESAAWHKVDCAGATSDNAAPPAIRRSQQRSEEEFHRLLTAVSDLEAKRPDDSCRHVTSEANMHFVTEDTPSLPEGLRSAQQPNERFERTRLIRSVRNSFTEASKWPRIARLLHLSQVELESQGLNVTDVTNHRRDFPRFAHTLFSEEGKSATRLFPLALFVEAARLPKTEKIHGDIVKYSNKLLEFRDAMLSEYLNVQRAYHDSLCENLSLNNATPLPSQGKPHQRNAFLQSWFAFEVRYLYEAEKAALRALRPLTECILTLEALMISEKREVLLAPPQDADQRKCTMKYLKAFCAAITRLAKLILPYNLAEAYHQTELFVVASAIRWKEKTESEAEHKSYATADREKSTQTNFFGIDYHMHLALTNVSEADITCYAFNEQAVAASHKLIYRFKELRDFLWTRRKCLDHLDPHIDKDVDTVQVLKRFEVACRQFRRRILRPENLV